MTPLPLRAEWKTNRSIALWRGTFCCGHIYFRDDLVDPSAHGWYAHFIHCGRDQRQRRPSATPQEAAIRMWGRSGRDAIAAAVGTAV